MSHILHMLCHNLTISDQLYESHFVKLRTVQFYINTHNISFVISFSITLFIIDLNLLIFYYYYFFYNIKNFSTKDI